MSRFFLEHAKHQKIGVYSQGHTVFSLKHLKASLYFFFFAGDKSCKDPKKWETLSDWTKLVLQMLINAELELSIGISTNCVLEILTVAGSPKPLHFLFFITPIFSGSSVSIL